MSRKNGTIPIASSAGNANAWKRHDWNNVGAIYHSEFSCIACRFDVKYPRIYENLVLGNSVMVARLTLDQLVGVRVPVPQFLQLSETRGLTKTDGQGR